MRKPIVAGTWKMNKTVAEARDLVEGIKLDLPDGYAAEVVLCPPFTALAAVSEAVSETRIDLGAQNMSEHPAGAYTGEVSAMMLKELFVTHVVLGHSELPQTPAWPPGAAWLRLPASVVSPACHRRRRRNWHPADRRR